MKKIGDKWTLSLDKIKTKLELAGMPTVPNLLKHDSILAIPSLDPTDQAAQAIIFAISSNRLFKV